MKWGPKTTKTKGRDPEERLRSSLETAVLPLAILAKASPEEGSHGWGKGHDSLRAHRQSEEATPGLWLFTSLGEANRPQKGNSDA